MILSGRVVDENNEPLIFATILLYQNDTLVTGGESDFNGYYRINEIDTGNYIIVASYIGYESKKKEVCVNQNITWNPILQEDPKIECSFYKSDCFLLNLDFKDFSNTTTFRNDNGVFRMSQF